MWPCIVTNFFLIKPTNHEFPKFCFVKKTLHVSDISFAHHQEFSTVHSTLLYLLQVWLQLPSRVKMELSSILTLLAICHQTCNKYTNVECTVENSWGWAKEMSETCRVFWQNKIWEIRASCPLQLKSSVSYITFRMQFASERLSNYATSGSAPYRSCPFCETSAMSVSAVGEIKGPRKGRLARCCESDTPVILH